MNSKDNTLANLLWINLPNDIDTDMGDFVLNPMIPLPIEPDDNGELNIEEVSWEKVIAATLLLLANNPTHEDAEYYREFLHALRPGLASQLSDAAEERMEDRDWHRAEEIMLALRGMNPKETEHRFALARLYDKRAAHESKSGEAVISENYTQAAEAAYNDLLSSSQVPESAWFFAGSFRYRNGDFLGAAEALETYIKVSGNGEYRNDAERMVRLCREEGQADELYRNAYGALTEGRIEEGITLARRFRDSRPEGWPGWFLLGWALRLSENWNEAREALDGAYQRGCREGDLFNEMAICTRSMEDYDAAEKALSQALQKDPDNIKIISNMAIIQLERGRRDEAVRWLETALTLEPGDRVCRKILEDIRNGAEGEL